MQQRNNFQAQKAENRGFDNMPPWSLRSNEIVADVPPPAPESVEEFLEFFNATSFKQAARSFARVCDILNLKPGRFDEFYPKLKLSLKAHLPFKCKEIWKLLETKSKLKTYGAVAEKQTVLVVGAGPCGLRTAIETQLLGARTIVIERRDEFTRNNVLKLWKFLIDDLKLLGAKTFYGHFCSGNINHVGIKTLQLILVKVCFILGVEILTPVRFVDLSKPDDSGKRWTAITDPPDSQAAKYEFDMLVIASGRKVALEGFDRRSLDAKLSIALTANFVNKGTSEEASVRQISGIGKQFHQDFFATLERDKGIALENIVYYRGETHYFVMTAVKKCLLERGVILQDGEDRKKLMSESNINREQLHQFVIDAAHYSTKHFSNQLPTIEFALDGRGDPDCDIFDFTHLYSARNASLVKVRKGHQLLMAIVGDSLLEPFWPEGTGCARGFLSSFDAAWMLRQWALGRRNPLDIICERENIYRLLTQTSDGQGSSLKDGYKSFNIDPKTRYRNIRKKIDHDRVLELYDSDAPEEFQFIREKFVNQQYYTPEEHKGILRRLRKNVVKKSCICFQPE